MTDLATGDAASAAPTPRSAWRAVALPTEHGGWGLTAEPVLLGLLVAFSGAGVALGVAAVLAFTARTPLKILLVDLHRGRALERTALARRVFLVEAAVLAVCLGVAALTAAHRFWVPMLIAAPLVAVELWFDMRSRSRRLLPELAGSVGIASVGAAIVLADGGPVAVAAGVWAVVAARAIASIPFVRYQVARARHRHDRPWVVAAAQATGVLVAAGAWAAGWLPPAGVVVIAALAAVQLALVRFPVPRVAFVGVQQLGFGLVVVLVSALTI